MQIEHTRHKRRPYAPVGSTTLNADEIYKLCCLIVGLVEVNDANLLDQASILSPYVGTRADHDAIRGIRDLINQLYLNFNYLESPRFEAEIAGKSPAFSDMLRKRVTDPVRCADYDVHTAWL